METSKQTGKVSKTDWSNLRPDGTRHREVKKEKPLTKKDYKDVFSLLMGSLETKPNELVNTPKINSAVTRARGGR